METMIFWGIVLLVVLCNFRMKFVEAFGLTVTSMFSLYLAFWQTDHYYTAAASLIPVQYEEYVKPCLVIVLFSVFFFLIRIVFKHVLTRYEKQMEESEESIFPKYFQIIGTLVCNMLMGIVLCSLLFLIAAVVPLTSLAKQISAGKLASEGKAGMMFVSAVVDTVAFQPWRLKDKEILMQKYLNSSVAVEERALQKKQ